MLNGINHASFLRIYDDLFDLFLHRESHRTPKELKKKILLPRVETQRLLAHREMFSVNLEFNPKQCAENDAAVAL